MIIRVFRYLGLKLVALGLAILLWFAVAGEPFVERGLRAPLEFQNIPEGFALLGEVPSTVDVRLRVQLIRDAKLRAVHGPAEQFPGIEFVASDERSV